MEYLVYQELAVQVLGTAIRDGDYPFIMEDDYILELWCAVAGLEVGVLQRRARDYWQGKREKMVALDRHKTAYDRLTV